MGFFGAVATPLDQAGFQTLTPSHRRLLDTALGRL